MENRPRAEENIQIIMSAMENATIYECFAALTRILRDHAEGWDMWNIQVNSDACNWAADEVEKVYSGFVEKTSWNGEGMRDYGRDMS